eukprot:NODE_224_length_13912_cov_0.116604.p6 type:complete len:241 gc:universal NODE_224_length_13912_cov_0.116604:12350-13072(+)
MKQPKPKIKVDQDRNFYKRQENKFDKLGLNYLSVFHDMTSTKAPSYDPDLMERFLVKMHQHFENFSDKNARHFSKFQRKTLLYSRTGKTIKDKKLVGEYNLFTYNNVNPIKFGELISDKELKLELDKPINLYKILESEFDVYLLVPEKSNPVNDVSNYYNSALSDTKGMILRDTVSEKFPKAFAVPAEFVIYSGEIRLPLQNALFLFVADMFQFDFNPNSSTFEVQCRKPVPLLPLENNV